jgi:Ion channel
VTAPAVVAHGPFVCSGCETWGVFSLPGEWRRILTWQDRHRVLVARLGFLVVVTLVVALVGTVAVYFLERDAPDTEITTVWDAFYFTTVQLLTVSSSLRNPLSTGGRILNIVFEFWGVIFVAGMTGSVATFFLTDDQGA